VLGDLEAKAVEAIRQRRIVARYCHIQAGKGRSSPTARKYEREALKSTKSVK
jgi:hypothetical protein